LSHGSYDSSGRDGRASGAGGGGSPEGDRSVRPRWHVADETQVVASHQRGELVPAPTLALEELIEVDLRDRVCGREVHQKWPWPGVVFSFEPDLLLLAVLDDPDRTTRRVLKMDGESDWHSIPPGRAASGG